MKRRNSINPRTATLWDAGAGKRASNAREIEQAEREDGEKRRIRALLQAHPSIGVSSRKGVPVYYCFVDQIYHERDSIDALISEVLA